MSAAATGSVAKRAAINPNPLQGHTPCQIVTIAMQLPNGSIQPRVCLVPYVGPIPAQTQVLTSLQQLQNFSLLTPGTQTGSPTLVPSPQPQPQAHPIFQSKKTSSKSSDETSEKTSSKSDERDACDEGEANAVSQGDHETAENEEVSINKPLPPSTNQVENCSNASTSLVAETIEASTVVPNVPETQENHVESHTTDAVLESIDAPKETNLVDVALTKAEPSAEKAEDPEPSRKVPPSLQPDEIPPPVVEVTPSVEAKDIKCEEEFPTLGGPSSPRTPRRVMSSEALSSVCSETVDVDPQENYTKAKIYKTVKRIRVRREKTPNAEEVGILEKNTRVQLLYVSGRKGRIVHPVNGWVSMKKKKEKQLVQLFCGIPAVKLSNLGRSLNREADVLKFLKNKRLRPTRCIWRKNEDFARVEFSSHQDATKLIKGSYTCDNVKMSAKWDEEYELTVDL